eukprot:8880693-Heterocapsa_arctica.AAC.1
MHLRPWPCHLGLDPFVALVSVQGAVQADTLLRAVSEELGAPMAAEASDTQVVSGVAANDAAEAVPVSHAGRLVLDQTSATTWALTDTATQESKPLPA